jgi:hypothetical protein
MIGDAPYAVEFVSRAAGAVMLARQLVPDIKRNVRAGTRTSLRRPVPGRAAG